MNVKLSNDKHKAGDKSQIYARNVRRAKIGAIGRAAVFAPLGDFGLDLTDLNRIFSANGAGIAKFRYFVVVELDKADLKDGIFVAFCYGFGDRGGPEEEESGHYKQFVQLQQRPHASENHRATSKLRDAPDVDFAIEQRSAVKEDCVIVEGDHKLFTKPSHFKLSKGHWISWEQHIEWISGGKVKPSQLGKVADSVERGEYGALREAYDQYLQSQRVETPEMQVGQTKQDLLPPSPESLNDGSPA